MATINGQVTPEAFTVDPGVVNEALRHAKRLAGQLIAIPGRAAEHTAMTLTMTSNVQKLGLQPHVIERGGLGFIGFSR